MILYDYIFERTGGLVGVLADKRSHRAFYYKWRDDARDKLNKEKCEVFEMGNLKGFYFKAGRVPSKKIVFIVHGYRSNHAETAGVWRRFYRKQGFDLFCPDNPAAGKSGGKYIGYDYFESLAALEWIEYLRTHLGYDIKIVLHGFSLGGATVVSMSDRVPDNVKFIIDDCGFSGGNDLLKSRLGILYKPICAMNKKIAGYDLKDTDVRPHLRNSRVPILFVHGRKDKLVPFRMGLELYTNCRSEKDCLFVDEAYHMESYFYKPEEYETKVKDFIRRYF